MTGNDEVKIIPAEPAGQVALPLNEEQFKDFIVSLLGKPQTISKRFRGSFEITKDNLVTLFELLNQRVQQQNDSKLIQFRATVYYNDNSTVTLSGFEHLVHYNETLPIVSKAIHLTWQYLIKFRDKNSFEKQEVSISFLANTDTPVEIDGEHTYYHENVANIRIQHTARTWGADIEALLTRHLNTIIQKESKIESFFKFNPEKIQNIIAAILTLITIMFATINTYQIRSSKLHDTDSIFWIHHYGGLLFLLAATFFLLKMTFAILEEFEVFNKPSFILLTTESLKDKNRTLKSYRQNWSRYLWTIISSIALGVLGNYVYTLLK